MSAKKECELPKLTDAAVVEMLEDEVCLYRCAYKQPDGVVRDAAVLRIIAALCSAASAVRLRSRMKGGAR